LCFFSFFCFFSFLCFRLRFFDALEPEIHRVDPEFGSTLRLL
jgi:hypothetical protein